MKLKHRLQWQITRMLRLLGVRQGLELRVWAQSEFLGLQRQENIHLWQGDSVEFSAPDEDGRTRIVVKLEAIDR